MDLSKFDTVASATKGADLHLRDPKGKPLYTDSGDPILITLLGADSKEYQSNQSKIIDRRLGMNLRNSSLQIDSEAMAAETLTLLVKATKGWKNIIVDGAELACNEENVRIVYDRFPWIYEQVNQFIGNRSNFLGNS